MSVTFIDVPGVLSSTTEAIDFTTTALVTSISVEYNPALGNGARETVFDGTTDAGAGGAFSYLYRASSRTGAGPYTWSIARQGRWPAEFRLRVKEVGSDVAEADYELPETPTAAPVEASEGFYSHNPLHGEEAANNLIEFFRKPRNMEMLRIVGGYLQDVEDVIEQLFEAFDAESATGAQLDDLGAVVGEHRDDRSDADFRAAVRARILVNSSDGKLEQLIAVCLAMVPTANITVQELYPAALRFTFDTIGTTTFRTISTMLHQAKAAGVRLNASVGTPTVGAVDGTPAGGIIGAVDGIPAGFVIAAGS